MRLPLFLLLPWLAAAAQDTAVVGPNETLRQVAERTVGDPDAAAEIMALNGLSSDAVAAGTRLKVPGHDRVLARKALETARTLVGDAGASPEAEVRLKEAETHFRAGRYAQASEAANAAGKHGAQPPTTHASSAFSVEVGADGGTTTVTVSRGPPVRVEAQGVTRPVPPGESLRVERGNPPPAPAAPLVAPRPALPEDGELLKRRPDKAGRLGPVRLAWAPVHGAERYVVEVSSDSEGASVFTQDVTSVDVKLPVLPAGRYRWTVRAVGPSGRSEPSLARRFELAPEQLKLEVKKGQWQ
ncbi:LysM peptidoglycan-binding domain-containing protein [Myxococcus sp. RHSTA-1-4]|uniref:LysM peptidoglycan-binding domain-containing protein n=1 Tax=Myxococcus sp. RHSTA-1-4 TaxID=2874601 RepID=UPI001CBDD2CB|nr:LysM peptidoglycan-binding domain-containing protein [Myxococcus sp. RHSTA-1-4]MBZ4418273.1 LysM peptidoglycan-binding domain-containing protein [Myxococcus sp. RHSTA-1-4]